MLFAFRIDLFRNFAYPQGVFQLFEGSERERERERCSLLTQCDLERTQWNMSPNFVIWRTFRFRRPCQWKFPTWIATKSSPGVMIFPLTCGFKHRSFRPTGNFPFGMIFAFFFPMEIRGLRSRDDEISLPEFMDFKQFGKTISVVQTRSDLFWPVHSGVRYKG